MPFLWAGLVLYEVVLVAVIVYAWRCGGPDERDGARALLATALASQVVGQFGHRWRFGPEYGIAICDVALFGALLFVCHRSRKFWPLYAAAASLVGVITHGGRWLQPSLAREVYATLQPFWALPVMLAIVIGVYQDRQR